MAIKPFLRPYPGVAAMNYYLPHVDPGATKETWSKIIPVAQIPLQDGETVFNDGITVGPQRISLQGTIYRAEYTTATEMQAAIDALKGATYVAETGSGSRVTFGRYDTTEDTSVWNDHAYVTGFTINGEPGLEYTGTNDCEWAIDIYIAKPDSWSTDGDEPAGADSDEIVLTASGRIVLVVNEALLIKDTAGNLKGMFTADSGDLEVAGDYGFL